MYAGGVAEVGSDGRKVQYVVVGLEELIDAEGHVLNLHTLNLDLCCK
jgi:hypothetical protein